MRDDVLVKGDKVLWAARFGLWEVEGIRAGWAWVFGPESLSGEIVHTDYLTKVQPRWEKDKRYRRKDDAGDLLEIVVTAVDDDGMALAYWNNSRGTRFYTARRADMRSDYIEI